jgi:hypothetical protein
MEIFFQRELFFGKLHFPLNLRFPLFFQKTVRTIDCFNDAKIFKTTSRLEKFSKKITAKQRLRFQPCNTPNKKKPQPIARLGLFYQPKN